MGAAITELRKLAATFQHAGTQGAQDAAAAFVRQTAEAIQANAQQAAPDANVTITYLGPTVAQVSAPHGTISGPPGVPMPVHAKPAAPGLVRDALHRTLGSDQPVAPQAGRSEKHPAAAPVAAVRAADLAADLVRLITVGH